MEQPSASTSLSKYLAEGFAKQDTELRQDGETPDKSANRRSPVN